MRIRLREFLVAPLAVLPIAVGLLFTAPPADAVGHNWSSSQVVTISGENGIRWNGLRWNAPASRAGGPRVITRWNPLVNQIGSADDGKTVKAHARVMWDNAGVGSCVASYNTWYRLQQAITDVRGDERWFTFWDSGQRGKTGAGPDSLEIRSGAPMPRGSRIKVRGEIITVVKPAPNCYDPTDKKGYYTYHSAPATFTLK